MDRLSFGSSSKRGNSLQLGLNMRIHHGEPQGWNHGQENHRWIPAGAEGSHQNDAAHNKDVSGVTGQSDGKAQTARSDQWGDRILMNAGDAPFHSDHFAFFLLP